MYIHEINSGEHPKSRQTFLGLGTGGWGDWFNNSQHPQTKWLLRDIELVPTLAEGLSNVSDSYFLPFLRPYTFLASKAEMQYELRNKYA